jgi:hypothetical protein
MLTRTGALELSLSAAYGVSAASAASEGVPAFSHQKKLGSAAIARPRAAVLPASVDGSVHLGNNWVVRRVPETVTMW